MLAAKKTNITTLFLVALALASGYALPAAAASLNHDDDREAELARRESEASKKFQNICDESRTYLADHFRKNIVRPMVDSVRSSGNSELSRTIVWRSHTLQITVKHSAGAPTMSFNLSRFGQATTLQEVVDSSLSINCRNFTTGLNPNETFAMTANAANVAADDSDTARLNEALGLINEFSNIKKTALGTAPTGTGITTRATKDREGIKASGANPTAEPEAAQFR